MEGPIKGSPFFIANYSHKKLNHMAQKSQNNLSKRNSRYSYVGSLEEYQLYGNSHKGKRYSQFEQDPYNKYQNFLYKRAMFGLKMYTPEEIKVMHWQKRKRIKKVHKRAQDAINIWKQELCNQYTNSFFQSLFPKSPVTKDLLEATSVDVEFKNTLSFKDLKVSKRDIIDKLTQQGVLPSNFLTLQENETKKEVL